LRATNGQLEQAWLVADWPAGDPAPHALFLADLRTPPNRARCLLLARSRRQVEQLFQRVKDDLGFDHYEGRSWRGFHHHHALVAAAYLFVLSVCLRAKKISGLTWEMTLRQIQPWLLKWIGWCHCCRRNYEDST
jgi:hypothetical protein